MVKLPAHDGPAILDQVLELAAAGAELCRLAVPDSAAIPVLAWLAPRSPVPLVADIHFDHRLALAAIEAGVSKLRINPGNLGGPGPLRQVSAAAGAAGVAIRVGVNLGSLEADIAAERGYTAEAMAASALRQVRMLEDEGFDAIVVSAKAPDVGRTVAAYRLISAATDWPLHLGVTEAGPGAAGLVKSAVGLGLLLAEGVGDTIRVSLSGSPVEEVRAGQAVLQCLGIRGFGPELVSCPTCGRCQFDLLRILPEVERRMERLRVPLVIAVMGCAVNGPGEARRADVGLAGAGRGQAVLFADGQALRTVPVERAVDELWQEIERIADSRGASLAPRGEAR
jgi:(E)-4-hydroxy-3-methylbut-2-enyl-diphosphate synthase